MATTKIWAIKGDIRSLVKYVDDPNKTTEQADDEMKNLFNVFDYATNSSKTEQKLFVSGVNCLPETAIQQMVMTKRQYGKTDKILAFHAIQSFKPGEVTPEQCHEIGLQLAREMWGEGYQVVVATHLDKAHLHNHFAINSVSFLDGKKYNSCKAATQQLRDVSDRLCRERGLSVIENPGRSPDRMLYLAEKNGEPTRYNVYRQAIDRAIRQSISPYTMMLVLQRQGFIASTNPKRHWTIALPGCRNTRMKTLGAEYTPQRIWKRFPLTPERPPPPKKPEPQRMRLLGSFNQVKKITGFQALYFHYLYLLGKLPKNRPHPPRHPILWEDVRKLEKYSAQIRLICRHKIDTSEQLQVYKDKTQSKMDELIAQRTKIQNKLRRAQDPEVIADLREQKAELSKQITVCRKDLKLCDGIKENTARMKEKMAVIRAHEKQIQPKTKQKNKQNRSFER